VLVRQLPAGGDHDLLCWLPRLGSKPLKFTSYDKLLCTSYDKISCVTGTKIN
jgi:hypothetical protein